jgi:hypothetical protein
VAGSSGSGSITPRACDWRGSQGSSPVRGSATGDVDGDGRQDGVSVIARYGARPGCRFALRVRLATGRLLVHRLADPLVGASAAENREQAWPRLLAVAKIDSHRGDQPVVSVDHGASTVVADVFAIRRGSLVRLRIADGSFSSGASRTASAVDCWHGRASGEVVSTLAFADPRGWSVIRRIYRLAGQRFRPVRPLRPPFHTGSLIALPEFQRGDLTVFPSCTISRPR